jgi:hypothetical protein
MNDICLAPNSPGAMEAVRAYGRGECITLCDGRRSWWCNEKRRPQDEAAESYVNPERWGYSG